MQHNPTVRTEPSSPARRAELALAGIAVATAAVYGVLFLWQYPLLGHVGTTTTQLPWIAPGRLHAALLAIGWLLLIALYVLAYVVCKGARGRRVVTIIVLGSAAFGVLMLLTYPFGSTDVFDYVARAHFAVDKGGVPMNTSPASYPGYPYYAYVTSIGVGSPYGPLWQWPSDIVAQVAGAGIVRNLLAMKLFVMGCYWAGIPVVYWTLRRVAGADPARGLLLYAWSPLAMLEIGADGHNDAVQVLCLAVAAALVVARRPAPAALAVVAAALVKYSPLVILPLFVVAIVRMARTWPRRLASLAGFVIAAAVLSVVSFLPFGRDAVGQTLSAVVGHGGLRANSLSWALLGTSSSTFATAVSLFGLAVVVMAVAYNCARLLRPSLVSERLPEEVIRRSFIVLLTLLVFGLSWFWPWYVLWLLPFAVIDRGRAVVALTIALGAGAFAVHWTSYYQEFFGVPHLPPAVVALFYGPLALTAAWLVLRRLRLPAIRPRPAS